MDLISAKQMARSLMDGHGLYDWAFEFDRAKRRRGLCSYTRTTISISAVLTPMRSENDVRNTILHEIAHALAGPKVQAHGPEWQRIAKQIGATAERGSRDSVTATPRYRLVCPNGHTRYRHRKLKRQLSCGECSNVFDPRYLFTWYDEVDEGN